MGQEKDEMNRQRERKPSLALLGGGSHVCLFSVTCTTDYELRLNRCHVLQTNIYSPSHKSLVGFKNLLINYPFSHYHWDFYLSEPTST